MGWDWADPGHTLLKRELPAAPNLEDRVMSKYSDEQPEYTPSYGSDDQESGMEMLSHPRCLSAIPGEVQEYMDEDSSYSYTDYSDSDSDSESGSQS